MDKIICDLCGTSYPDTASQCPICGTPRPDAAAAQSADSEADSYAYVRGGRFSKSNVRRRAGGTQETRRREEPSHRRETRKAQEEAPQPEEEEGSNKGLIIVVIILLLAIIAACVYIGVQIVNKTRPGNGPSDSTQSTAAVKIPCTGVSLDQKELTFDAVNKTILLQPVLMPADTTDEVIFLSSDENVVKVDGDGLVTPVADGTAVITVACGQYRVECQVVCDMGVEPPPTEPPATEPPATDPSGTEPGPSMPPINIFSLNRREFTLSGYGATWDLTMDSPDPYYDGANYSGPADPSLIEWSSDDPTVAIVENGVVTAVGDGKCNIIAIYEGATRKCLVRCNNVVPPEDDYQLSHTDVTLPVGSIFTLSLLDGNTRLEDVTFQVADAAVCSVDDMGNVTGLSVGTTTVSIVYLGKTYECTVRVKA